MIEIDALNHEIAGLADAQWRLDQQMTGLIERSRELVGAIKMTHHAAWCDGRLCVVRFRRADRSRYWQRLDELNAELGPLRRERRAVTAALAGATKERDLLFAHAKGLGHGTAKNVFRDFKTKSRGKSRN